MFHIQGFVFLLKTYRICLNSYRNLKGSYVDVLFTILCAVIVIGVIVVIHEGGHFLAARAFGVRVVEFMVGLPGPCIGFTSGETKFGITAVPLGGYAKVCGMETGPVNSHLKDVLAFCLEQGTTDAQSVSQHLGISYDDAEEALDELVEWGSLERKTKRGQPDIYLTPKIVPTKRQKSLSKTLYTSVQNPENAGTKRKVRDINLFFEREKKQQYRNLPFWKRSVILLAGIFVNLLFAIVAFIVVYSIIGVDYVDASGVTHHILLNPLQSIQAGFGCIVMTFQAILGLFNPQTAAETVSNSTSIVGIAVMSRDFFAQGVADALFFMAIISISIGLMNLLPIPPLDGGRFLIEIIQKITKRDVPMRVMGYISMAGMALFMVFFIFMLNQDIQRFIFGNW